MATTASRTSLLLWTSRSTPDVLIARSSGPMSLLGRRALSSSRPTFNLQRPFFSPRRLPWPGTLSQLISQLRLALNNKFLLLVALFGNQFNAIAAQRIRRALQIVNLYNNLGYDRRMVRNIVEKMGAALPKKLRSDPFGILLGAAFFTWETQRISDDELTKVSDEIVHIQRMKKGPSTTGDAENYFTDMEKIIDKGFVIMWRKAVPNSYLYEYKVYGTYHDLPARAFFAVQVDLEFRRQWDKLVISLDVIDKEDESGSEVVHWIMHYPYPMYSRDYVYIRKYKVDCEKRLMVIVNRSIEHPARPLDSKYVRVDTYTSNMVIKPHTSFDENGFDYVLTYYDDPKAAFPSVAYNWMANTGVPDFVEKLHSAAKILHDRKKIKHDDEPSEDKDRIPM